MIDCYLIITTVAGDIINLRDPDVKKQWYEYFKMVKLILAFISIDKKQCEKYLNVCMIAALCSF